jgi:hypothetical protein
MYGVGQAIGSVLLGGVLWLVAAAGFVVAGVLVMAVVASLLALVT